MKEYENEARQSANVHWQFEQMTERKQRRSFQGLKNAGTSIMTKGLSFDWKTAKTVRTVLKQYGLK